MWEHRFGNYLLQRDSGHSIGVNRKPIDERDARKLFNFIDYNGAHVVSKHQIRLLI